MQTRVTFVLAEGLTKGVGPSNEQQTGGRSVGRKDVLTGSPHTDRGGTVGWSVRACVRARVTDGRDARDGRDQRSVRHSDA